MSQDRTYYSIKLNHGEMTVYLPDEIDASEVTDIDDVFELILKQTRRRTEEKANDITT